MPKRDLHPWTQADLDVAIREVRACFEGSDSRTPECAADAVLRALRHRALEPAQEPRPNHGVGREHGHTAALERLEARLRELDVERVVFKGGLVTLTTRQTERGHAHGEGATLADAVRELVDRLQPRR